MTHASMRNETWAGQMTVLPFSRRRHAYDTIYDAVVQEAVERGVSLRSAMERADEALSQVRGLVAAASTAPRAPS
jgi:hypothetical protein